MVPTSSAGIFSWHGVVSALMDSAFLFAALLAAFVISFAQAGFCMKDPHSTSETILAARQLLEAAG